MQQQGLQQLHDFSVHSSFGVRWVSSMTSSIGRSFSFITFFSVTSFFSLFSFFLPFLAILPKINNESKLSRRERLFMKSPNNSSL